MAKKLKTHKATAKRFSVKKTSKGLTVTKRTNGQDHFNSRESGNTRRNKRSDKIVSDAMKRRVKAVVPYV